MSSPVAIETIAARTMAWPFRMWSFGEQIALRGLLAAATHLERRDYRQHVAALCLATIGRGVGRGSDDHLAPGSAFLELYETNGDPRYLEAARSLIEFHRGLPRNPQGALLVRAYQAGWRHQVWVDSMDIIGPLFARFGAVSGEGEPFHEAVALTLEHARLLQTDSGLFMHGYDTHAGANGHLWARGAGWALLGMVETLALVPPEIPGRAELAERLAALLSALARTQRPSGLWTTVIDRDGSYEETTLAAMCVHGIALGERHGLVAPGAYKDMTSAALGAVRANVSPDGALGLVSEATPIGRFSTYATRPFGVFPWGQGSLLLLECDQ